MQGRSGAGLDVRPRPLARASTRIAAQNIHQEAARVLARALIEAVRDQRGHRQEGPWRQRGMAARRRGQASLRVRVRAQLGAQAGHAGAEHSGRRAAAGHGRRARSARSTSRPVRPPTPISRSTATSPKRNCCASSRKPTPPTGSATASSGTAAAVKYGPRGGGSPNVMTPRARLAAAAEVAETATSWS